MLQVPEQGMQRFEVLSRASAAVVVDPSQRPRLVSSRHVTHPFLYASSYYADRPWLECVDESHIRCSVEVYEVRGGIACRREAAHLLL